MKIGILTFHRAHNYGAVLQAYALQESIRKLGHDVVIIDYRQPYNEQVYAVDFEWRLFFRNLIHLKRRKVFNYIKDKHFKLHRSLIFWEFRKKYLNIEMKKDGGFPRCDRYIVGSDQVWSFHCTNGYDPILWGEFSRPNESKLYGFSISSNGDFFNYMTNEKIVSRMEVFTDISFKEYHKNIAVKEAESIYKLLNGNTFCLQKTFNVAFSMTYENTICDASIMLRAIEDIILENEHTYKMMLSTLSPQPKEVLYAIAADGTANRVTSGDFVRRHQLKSSSSVQSAIKQLLDGDWITHYSDGKNNKTYMVNDPFLQLWLLKQIGQGYQLEL